VLLPKTNVLLFSSAGSFSASPRSFPIFLIHLLTGPPNPSHSSPHPMPVAAAAPLLSPRVMAVGCSLISVRMRHSPDEAGVRRPGGAILPLLHLLPSSAVPYQRPLSNNWPVQKPDSAPARLRSGWWWLVGPFFRPLTWLLLRRPSLPGVMHLSPEHVSPRCSLGGEVISVR
jgi:hypothetical protein